MIMLVFIGFGFASCSEQECCPIPEGEPKLIGTWKLDKLCYSDGASSCNEEDMWDAEISQIITFFESGEFTFNINGEICSGTYLNKTNDINDVVTLNATLGNCNFESASYFLELRAVNEIMFSPQCIEGCPHLYVRE